MGSKSALLSKNNRLDKLRVFCRKLRVSRWMVMEVREKTSRRRVENWRGLQCRMLNCGFPATFRFWANCKKVLVTCCSSYVDIFFWVGVRLRRTSARDFTPTGRSLGTDKTRNVRVLVGFTEVQLRHGLNLLHCKEH